MRCRHCQNRVIHLPDVEKMWGKGEPPEWRHDPNDNEHGPTCGRGALRDSDVEDDPDADEET